VSPIAAVSKKRFKNKPSNKCPKEARKRTAQEADKIKKPNETPSDQQSDWEIDASPKERRF
jgi:hypothetical protein